jgi:ATP-dependent helicase/nuclease subunit B
MNRLHEAIARLCQEHLLDEKWLVAPSRRVGYQWLDAVTRTGQAAVNVRVQTLKALALFLAGSAMAQTGAKLLSARAGTILVGQVWNRRRREGYLFSMPTSKSLCRTLYGTLTDLRLAAVEPGDFRPEHLEVAAKGRELASLLQQYKEELKARKLVDYADVLRMAAQSLGELKPGAELPLVLLPADLDLTLLEQRLIERVSKDRLLVLPVDEPGKPPEQTKDVGLLGWLLSPADAPAPAGDGTAAVFHAIGEVNEVREVVRRCLATGTPLDDVELLYADSQAYLPLIYELARRLEADPVTPGSPGQTEATQPAGLSVTFAEGIPVRYSRPGRALAAWLQWIGEDYPQNILVRMLQDGLLELPEAAEGEFGFARLAGMLRAVPIGFGRDRYLARLDEQIAALEHQAKTDLAADEDGESDPDKPARTARRLAGMRVLRELTGRLLGICPPTDAKPAEILKAATALLETLARSVSELDTLARQRLQQDIAEMATLFEEEGDYSGMDPWEYLSSLPEGLRVGGSGPRPGCLHCAHVLSGGHSGRMNTFIIGLDDQRFPGAGLQDPILLDGERRDLSDELPTSARDLHRRVANLAGLLARLRGRVTLSYASRDLIEDREAFASPALLAAFRILSGNRHGDQTDLARWLAPPASFVPETDTAAIDAAEWWLWCTCGSQGMEDASQVVAEEFPHLGRGMLAARKRASQEFTEYDGRVDGIVPEQDPTTVNGPALSPSALETIGRCPLAYFFKYVLRVEPPEEIEIDPKQWLDSAQFGALLHEVFCIFMRELVSAGALPPRYDRDRPRLDQILAAQIEEYKRQAPPPNERAFRRQRHELQQAIHIFLTEEERYCRDHWPAYMEVSIGLPASENGTALDSTEPVELPLGNGQVMRIRGRIDRIDRVAGPEVSTFALWDYKTGSPWRYRQKQPFWQGRVLQHAIYLHLAANRLRQLDPAATIAQVGYFFPGHRGRGERIAYAPQELDAGLGILQRLCSVVGRGTFLATDNCEHDCTYCDYRQVCGDLDGLSQTSRLKLQGDNQRLEPLQELRGYHE